MAAGLFVNAVLLKHNKTNILCFLLKLCQYVGGVNYRTFCMSNLINYEIKQPQLL